MRVLVVKLTSMGDALHLLPALTDLQASREGVIIDWMIEDSFAEIPAWHNSVDRIITVSTRRWRKMSRLNIAEFLSFWKYLRSQPYDVVIDAQGLIKSAVFARFAKLVNGGFRAGFSGNSIKESPAAKLYHKKIEVDRKQHAIHRVRQLFAGVFQYELPNLAPSYALQLAKPTRSQRRSVMLFHGTTWSTKHLPDQVWRDIAKLAEDDGYFVKLAWGNDIEKSRAHWIANDRQNIEILPKSNLAALAQELASVDGVIAVDTGLGHMAAALSVPCVSVYGATDAKLTGTVGENQIQLQSTYPCSPCLLKKCAKLTDQVTTPPCYRELDAATLWQALFQEIA